MGYDRDVLAFDQRAGQYEQGRLGRWHRRVVQQFAGLALENAPAARRVLDVGCGTGMLLAELAARLPCAELTGVDPARSMVAEAIESRSRRVTVVAGRAERLPFSAGAFDMVASTTSFDHWADQDRGLAECARVLEPGGHLLVADLFAPWLGPTALVGRGRGRARTPGRMNRLLADTFDIQSWRPITFPIQAVVAIKKDR